MRRINAEIQGGKVQEYWRISSLSDAEVQYLDKQKIQDLVGTSIISNHLVGNLYCTEHAIHHRQSYAIVFMAANLTINLMGISITQLTIHHLSFHGCYNSPYYSWLVFRHFQVRAKQVLLYRQSEYPL